MCKSHCVIAAPTEETRSQRRIFMGGRCCPSAAETAPPQAYPAISRFESSPVCRQKTVFACRRFDSEISPDRFFPAITPGKVEWDPVFSRHSHFIYNIPFLPLCPFFRWRLFAGGKAEFHIQLPLGSTRGLVGTVHDKEAQFAFLLCGIESAQIHQFDCGCPVERNSKCFSGVFD